MRIEGTVVVVTGGAASFVRRKTADPDRWLAGMRRLVARAGGA